MNDIERSLQERYFPRILFADERERQVFFSYIRGFYLLVMDPSVGRVLELGGGQSTALLASLAHRLKWHLITIDMKPDAVAQKLRNDDLSVEVLSQIEFLKGVTVGSQSIKSYWRGHHETIGGVPFKTAIQSAADFVDASMDNRKAQPIAEALGFSHFDAELVIEALSSSLSFPQPVMEIYRTPGDELSEIPGELISECLESVFDRGPVDAVFMDSGEFSSLVEWEVVRRRLRNGGYAVLHDIFFPKSFKNWLVAGSMAADPSFEIVFVDRSTPQGLLVARKIGE